MKPFVSICFILSLYLYCLAFLSVYQIYVRFLVCLHVVRKMMTKFRVRCKARKLRQEMPIL